MDTLAFFTGLITGALTSLVLFIAFALRLVAKHKAKAAPDGNARDLKQKTTAAWTAGWKHGVHNTLNALAKEEEPAPKKNRFDDDSLWHN